MLLSARALAALVVSQVVHSGRTLDTALAGIVERLRVPTDRALLQQLCYGTVRWHTRLEALAGQLLSRPLRAQDADVLCLLLVGLFQLLYLRVPTHAAVTETVAAARELGKPWATSLLNGVLRNFLRRREALLGQADLNPSVALSHTPWLLARLQEDWSQHWRDIANANNQAPPMVLRVNRRRNTRDAYLQRLAALGLAASPVAYAADALHLANPCPVTELPGFAAGEVSVQDAAAQLAVDLLDLHPGQRVLDACAAPGGKTAHILERVPDLGTVSALDVDGGRLEQLRENLRRLDLDSEARLLLGDATQVQTWWDGVPFDRILVDAPCSASGVIRRHPDIKLLRRVSDLPRLAERQSAMLRALWHTLQPGGVLVYATCSVFATENEAVVGAFLAQTPDARERPADAAWGRDRKPGRQILPGENDMDGFYYACIEKWR